jgi:hypothetical protein
MRYLIGRIKLVASVGLLVVITAATAFSGASDPAEVKSQSDDTHSWLPTGVDAQFAWIPDFVDASVDTAWFKAADLDTMGWRGLLPEKLDDTCSIRRTSFIDAKAFGTWELEDPPRGPHDWKGTPLTIDLHVFTPAATNQPLFALAYKDWSDARSVKPVGYGKTLRLLKNVASVEVVDTECEGALRTWGGAISVIGCWGPGSTRYDLAHVRLTVFHRVSVEIAGARACAWIIASYGKERIPEHFDRDVAGCSSRLDIVHAGPGPQLDLHGAEFLTWDGFPEHPENIKVMDNLEERFREYQQQRQQWLEEREQKKE